MNAKIVFEVEQLGMPNETKIVIIKNGVRKEFIAPPYDPDAPRPEPVDSYKGMTAAQIVEGILEEGTTCYYMEPEQKQAIRDILKENQRLKDKIEDLEMNIAAFEDQTGD